MKMQRIILYCLVFFAVLVSAVSSTQLNRNPRKCRRNEIFQECASACAVEPTCQDQNPTTPLVCTDNCVQRCECVPGYIRSRLQGKCIKNEDCKRICSCNEYYNDCSSACAVEPTCDNVSPTTTVGPCTLQCIQRCECREGYVRNRQTSQCVKIDECPQCPQNEHLGCKPCCRSPTCQNMEPGPCKDPCPKICLLECQCNMGYLRDLTTGKCILGKYCPI